MKPEPPEGTIYEVRFRRIGGGDVWFGAYARQPSIEDAKAEALEALKAWPQDPSDYDIDNPEVFNALPPNRPGSDT